MGVEGIDALIAAQRPQLQQPVRSSGQQLHAPTQEAELQNRRRVAFQRLQALMCGDRPNFDRTVGAASRDHFVHW